jgi:HD-like signal output (HDOD) protein/CheY-like chemotaxis protein
VLIVDDHAMFREPIGSILQSEGYTTVLAASGREAVALMAWSTPDLVLLDLHMPLMSGFQVLEHMRRTAPLRAVPVIVLSAVHDRASVMKAAQLGISGYVLKDRASASELLRRVTDALREVAAVASRSAGGPRPDPHDAVAAHGGVQPQPNARCGSSGREALRVLVPALTRAELFRRVAACNDFGGLSPAVSQVLALTADPRCSGDAVARALGQDYGLAIRVLKLANSAAYSRGEPIDSLQKAVVRIGAERLRRTVLTISIIDRFSAPAFAEELDTGQFWEHSIACAVVASEIARVTGARDAEAAFISGLMHDVGRLVMAEQLGGLYLDVLSCARRLDVPLEHVEARVLGADHADVSERALRAWNFPPHLLTPIVLHHSSIGTIRSAAPGRVAESARLSLANRVAHALMLGSSGNDVLYPTGDLCDALSLGAENLNEIIAAAARQTADLKQALFPQPGGGRSRQRIEQHRRSLAGPFHPLFISARPGTDGIGAFCAALAGERAARPNIAVLHIERPGEQEPLLERLRSAEAEWEGRLPLIALTSPQQDPLKMELAHVQLQLPTPVRIHSFIAGVNALSAMACDRAGAAAA